MYRIIQIRVLGVTKLRTDVEVENLEDFRTNVADTYRVRKSSVRLTYETLKIA